VGDALSGADSGDLDIPDVEGVLCRPLGCALACRRRPHDPYEQVEGRAPTDEGRQHDMGRHRRDHAGEDVTEDSPRGCSPGASKRLDVGEDRPHRPQVFDWRRVVRIALRVGHLAHHATSPW
jgi:hypothetical protein